MNVLPYLRLAIPPLPSPPPALPNCPIPSPGIMGEFIISTSMTVFVWFTSVGIIGVNLYIVGGFLLNQGMSTSGNRWLYAAAAIGGVFYLGFVAFLIRQDLLRLTDKASAFFSQLGVGDLSDIAHLQYHSPPENSDLLPGPTAAGRHTNLSDDGESDGAPEAGREDGDFSGTGQDYNPLGR